MVFLILQHFCHPPEVTPDAVCGYLCHWEMRCFFKIFALLFKDTQVMETHPFDALEVFTGPMYIVFLFWPSGSGSFRMGGNVLKWLAGLNLDIDKSPQVVPYYDTNFHRLHCEVAEDCVFWV